jgi:hypothetical protein
MKKTIIAGGLAAASLAALIGGAALAARQTPAATAAQTAHRCAMRAWKPAAPSRSPRPSSFRPASAD